MAGKPGGRGIEIRYCFDEVDANSGTEGVVAHATVWCRTKGKSQTHRRWVADRLSWKMLEQLQVPSLDETISVIRAAHSLSPECPLSGWVIDEKKAFRQVPVLPSHRHLAVGENAPEKGAVGHFIMLSHPFGLTASVMNFNRRAHASTWVLARLSKMLTLNFYDDHFGFTKESLVHEECALVLVCTLLGIQTYNFRESLLMVTETRRATLFSRLSASCSEVLCCLEEPRRCEGGWDLWPVTCLAATDAPSCWLCRSGSAGGLGLLSSRNH